MERRQYVHRWLLSINWPVSMQMKAGSWCFRVSAPVQISFHVSYRRMVNVRNAGGIYHDISEAVICTAIDSCILLTANKMQPAVGVVFRHGISRNWWRRASRTSLAMYTPMANRRNPLQQKNLVVVRQKGPGEQRFLAPPIRRGKYLDRYPL